MNFRSISFYLSLFCFPVSILAFINILYSSYFDFYLSIESYLITLLFSLILGSWLIYYGKNADKKINFIDQLILIVSVYLVIGFLISIPFYKSNLQISFVNAFFESISGLTSTGFSTFSNVKYLIDLFRSISFFKIEIFFSAKLFTISFVVTEPKSWPVSLAALINITSCCESIYNKK